jgi:hypothetical protein
MATLLRIDSTGTPHQLIPKEFQNEVDDLQRYIVKNPAVVGEKIEIVAEQLDTGSGKRLDILALERVSTDQVRPVVVELKNVEADTDALLQVLKYADWVLGHIDSVKLHAEKKGIKYKELDNTSVKVSVVAPIIRSDLLELGGYIGKNIDFEFVQFQRFQDEHGDLILIDRRVPMSSPTSITTAQEEWDWNRFENKLKINKDRLKVGQYLYDALIQINNDNNWGLTPVFRKYYIPFKKSGYNIFEIDLYSKVCALGIQLSKSPKKLGLPPIYPDIEQGYSAEYNRYWFHFPNTDIETEKLAIYIEKAIELLGL